MVVQAERDSVVIEDEEVEAQLDNQIQSALLISMVQKKHLEEIAGRTVYQIKKISVQLPQKRKLAEKMQAKIAEGVRVTPQEVKAYYDKIPRTV